MSKGTTQSEEEGGEIAGPLDPNDPSQVAQYISFYLRNKVLPVRANQGKLLNCFTITLVHC